MNVPEARVIEAETEHVIDRKNQAHYESNGVENANTKNPPHRKDVKERALRVKVWILQESSFLRRTKEKVELECTSKALINQNSNFDTWIDTWLTSLVLD